MPTPSSETIKALLDAGFTRPTIASATNLSLQEISAIKTERLDMSEDVQQKLKGLLCWAQAMKEACGFNVNPAPYYELQMIVLTIEGGKKYTALHYLYEAGLLTSDEMKKISLKFSDLYDYSAFMDEFPERADICLEGETKLVIHHGLPEIQYDNEAEKRKTRQALEEILYEDSMEKERAA